MTIGIVADRLDPATYISQRDSPTDHVACLASALGELGHIATVYVRRTDPELPAELRLGHGVTVRQVDAGPPRPLPSAELLSSIGAFGGGLAAQWQHDQPVVVHTHHWTSALAALVGRRGTEVPVIQTFQPGELALTAADSADIEPSEQVRLERAICHDAHHVTVGSSEDLQELATLGTPRNKVTIVPRGIDVDRFSPNGPAYPRSERPRLLSLGPLDAKNGFDTAIRALAAVPEAELVLAVTSNGRGHRSEVRRLATAAHRSGVADRVHLLRRVALSRLPALIRSADLVLCVSSYEPAAAPALEAMACAKPVIASEVGSFADSVIDGVTGSFVRPGQTEELASAIRDLLAEETRLQGYGMTARERVQARYSWFRVASETARVYSAVASSRAA